MHEIYNIYIYIFIIIENGKKIEGMYEPPMSSIEIAKLKFMKSCAGIILNPPLILLSWMLI